MVWPKLEPLQRSCPEQLAGCSAPVFISLYISHHSTLRDKGALRHADGDFTAQRDLSDLNIGSQHRPS